MGNDLLVEEHFRKTIVSSYHYFGTASFGKVVEGDTMTVKGTQNLHAAWFRSYNPQVRADFMQISTPMLLPESFS